jgi:putative endonuclease
MVNNVASGKYGEKLACEYLTSIGYVILQKNYRCTKGEIDIIVRDKEYIVFVEVKYRKNLKFGYPRESVGVRKQEKIKNSAVWYTFQNNIQDTDIRFDIVEILHMKKIELEHIKNAYY